MDNNGERRTRPGYHGGRATENSGEETAENGGVDSNYHRLGNEVIT